MNVSCAVLAGGESRRMGSNKALVDFDGRPLVARIVHRLASCSNDVFVVAKSATELAPLGVRVALDEGEVRTPLAGILAALRVAMHPHVFVCATDMPYVSPALIEMLTSRISSADAVVPERDGRLEPLHAVWSRSAADVVGAQIDSGERAVHRVLRLLDTIVVGEDVWRTADPSGTSFTNLNTPDELIGARR